MVLKDQLAIGFLDLFVGRLSRDAEYLVIIHPCHAKDYSMRSHRFHLTTLGRRLIDLIIAT
ncbi:MAG: hypothetical protein NTAFB01_28450 [Nitrospira sp.]